MRTGSCSVHQATPEAASIVKQAVSLAHRRGHAQVTPLHVANAMLSSPTGLLRAACLQSHSHPLQCKALELCFNVALNRLPASSVAAGPILGSHRHPPLLSNALVAAFKRAQAHQRRGSIENQQQPLLAVKIELEQLIISILDDPSVSRVMREAGFSSTQVKSNVEQAVSVDATISSPAVNKPKEAVLPTVKQPVNLPLMDKIRADDITSVIDILSTSRRKKSMVIVGECAATAEGVIRGVMDRVDKGEVPEALKNLQFISLPIFSFRQLGREEVEQKIVELRCLVKSCCVGRGAVLYLGDLQWAAEYRASRAEKGRAVAGFYCPVEHIIMEIGRIVYSGAAAASTDGGETARFWLLGIATYQTYMKCRAGNPSLETVWSLQPLTIPAGSLGLSLSYDSDTSQSRSKSKRSGGAFWSLQVDDGVDDQNQLTCCADCTTKFESEARDLANKNNSNSLQIISSSSSTLPPWLQQYKDQTKHDEDCISVKELCKKWNSICNSVHPERQLHSSSPTTSSISSYEQIQHFAESCVRRWPPAPITARPPWVSESCDNESLLISRVSTLPPILSCGNPNPNSTSSSDTMEIENLQRFKELNAENLKNLCNSLERKVPWQIDIIPEIASTVLQCRSGMMRRKERISSTKEDTWLFFIGSDVHGKEKVGRELANLVFGSRKNFVSIGLSNFSSTKSGSSEDVRNKRCRSEANHSYVERLVEALRDNPHRVIFMEDIEQIDYYSQMGIKTAIETGSVRNVRVSDAIVILSCESFDSRSRACSPPVKQKSESGEEKEEEEENCEREEEGSSGLDLNVCADHHDHNEGGEDCLLDDVGLLESLDGYFFFKLREDL